MARYPSQLISIESDAPDTKESLSGVHKPTLSGARKPTSRLPTKKDDTLRDHFAAMAMQALLTGPRPAEWVDHRAQIAQKAYLMADAMLAERGEA